MHRTSIILLALFAAGCNLFSATAEGVDEDMGTLDFAGADLAGPDVSAPDVATPFDAGGGDDTNAPADLGPDDTGPDDTGPMDMGDEPDMPTDMSMDAGADMPPDMSGDPCLWPETVFCDGFEDPLLLPWVELLASDATYMPTGSPRRTGLAAIGFDVTADGGSSGVATTLSAPLVAPNAYWLRVFVYLPSAVGDQFDLYAGLGTVAGSEVVVVGISPADMSILLGIVGGTLHLEDATPPRDQWVCVEALFDLGPNGRVQAYYDGQQVVDEDVQGTFTSPLTELFIGIEGTTGTGGQMDDIIVSTIRPGCN